MSNEEIVSEIRAGRSVSENMEILYTRNLPLIKKTIKPYAAYEPMEDLLQESYFGLWEAVQHYETSENVKFSTYAIYWWRQSAQRYIEKYSSTVRIPTHTRAKMSRIRKAAEQIRQEQGREPTSKDIADLLKISVENVREIQTYMQGVTSLDTPLTDDNSLALSDTLQAPDSTENEVIDKIYDEHSKSRLWGIVERYTSKRENIIIRKIFINNRTMAAVAKEQGISLDRIRQIKEKGLRRLRIGKARRELLEKFDIADTMLYRGSLNDYKEKGGSVVERVVTKRIEIEEYYKRYLEELRKW